MSPTDLIGLLDKGGVLAVLVLAVLALARISMKLFLLLLAQKDQAYSALKEERDQWRTVALGLLNTADRVAKTAEQQLGIPLAPP